MTVQRRRPAKVEKEAPTWSRWSLARAVRAPAPAVADVVGLLVRLDWEAWRETRIEREVDIDVMVDAVAAKAASLSTVGAMEMRRHMIRTWKRRAKAGRERRWRRDDAAEVVGVVGA